jgi:hypothetical protein
MDDITKRERRVASMDVWRLQEATANGDIRWANPTGETWHGDWWTAPAIRLLLNAEGYFEEPCSESVVYFTPSGDEPTSFAQLYEAIIQQQIEKGEE